MKGKWGFNSALIRLLKQKTTPSPTFNPVPNPASNSYKKHPTENQKLLKALGYALYSMLRADVIDSLINYKEDRNKLQAIKLLKSETQVGLKEAKEFMDDWFVM